MRILSEKKLKELLGKAYEDGLSQGYQYGWRMRQVERSNRGCILGGYNVQKEVDEILRKER